MSSQAPMISTILLNWNRKDLLAKTLDSLSKTTTVPHEIIVIDNGSTDDSPELIRQFAQNDKNVARIGGVKTIFLPDNIGGEALNQGIDIAKGDLIHLTENDLEYLPGWDAKVVADFQAFPTLGQLSVFGPVPTDDEAWELKKCRMLHDGGHILYEAIGNVGTSSVLRREVIESGVRVHNLISDGPFKFPDDARLSEDVRSSNFVVAWNNFYLVRNLGHLGTELEARLEYYRSNYSSKANVGVEGLEARLKKWRDQPRPTRRSEVLDQEQFSAEISQPSPECPNPQLWTMIDSWTAEAETLDFMYALVRLVKPRNLLETGTWLGAGAVAIGRALKANGFGRLVTLEIDPPSAAVARERVDKYDLSEIVSVVETSSLNYVPAETLDFLFLDSAIDTRGPEFKYFRPFLKPGSMVVFHDTSTTHVIVREQIDGLISEGFLRGLYLPSPRGLSITEYIGEPKPEAASVPVAPSFDPSPVSVRMRLGRIKRELKAIIGA